MSTMNNKDLKLIYIHNLGLNSEDKFQYNLYFIQKDFELCNENWTEDIAGLFNDKYIPNNKNKIFSMISEKPLSIITDNLCLGMKHAIDGVVALAWEDISDYEEYPEDGRLILFYGETLENVKNILHEKNEMLVE